MGEYLHLGEYFIRARIGLGLAGLGSWLDLLSSGSSDQDKGMEEEYDTVMTPWGVSPVGTTLPSPLDNFTNIFSHLTISISPLLTPLYYLPSTICRTY